MGEVIHCSLWGPAPGHQGSYTLDRDWWFSPVPYLLTRWSRPAGVRVKRDRDIRWVECKEIVMTVDQATADVFLTAFKALPRREQADILGRIARDRGLRRVLEGIVDRLAIEEERAKPSRPLRDYIAERERRERGGAKATR